MGLVGRDGELAQLRTLLDGAAAGRGGVVFVEGEPGIGKSTLLRAGLGYAGRAGCRLLWGSADELMRRFPLRPLLDSLDAGDVRDPRRAEIDRLFRGDDLGPASGHADPVAAACEQFHALLDELCATGPVVLVVEDLHWADETTVATWHRLARSVNQVPLLLAGSARPVPQRDDLAVLRRGMTALGGIKLSLEPLQDAEVDDLVTALAGAPPGPRLRRLAADAAGNPLYVTELIEALSRDGTLRVERGVAEAPARARSASVSAAITARAAFLTDPARDVLQVASLLGATFSVTDLSVITRQPATALFGPIAEATAAGVLVEAEENLAFRHALIRDGLRDDLPGSIRAALHHDAARALAEAGMSADRVAAQLLRISETGPRGTLVLENWAVDWLSAAAPALVSQATDVAVDLLTAALASIPAGDARHSQLSVGLVAALCRAGRPKECERVARDALARTSDPEVVGQLYWFLGECLLIDGRGAEAIVHLEQALATRPLSPVHRARLQVIAGRCHAIRDISLAERIAQAVLAEPPEGDRVAVAYAYNMLATGRHGWGDAQQALGLYERGLAVARDDPELADLRVVIQSNRANALASLDRFTDARHAIQQVIRLAESTGNAPRVGLARAEFVAVGYDTGQWDEALAEIAAPMEYLAPQPASYLHGFAALIALHRDDAEALRFHLEEGAEPAKTVSGGWDAPAVLARALEDERAGRVDGAVSTLSAHLLSDPAVVTSWDTDICGLDAVRLAVLARDSSRAGELARPVEELAEREGTLSRRAAAQYCRGVIEADPDALIEAARQFEAVGRPLRHAQALEAAAGLRAERGDAATAGRLLTEALELYSGLDAASDTARVDGRFAAYGLRRGRAARRARPRSGPGSLTATETRIAQLVAEGLSNPQIGDHLFLSRRTVQSHVSNILAKLEFHSRVDIAREFATR